MEINRLLEIPDHSFLLLGPRGTGKSTLIKQKLTIALEIDLLTSKNYLALKANPSLIQDWTKNLSKGDWVFIDEIQKVPMLMDEVHSLIEKKKLKFALSGSSARKLKKEGVNLLAGRALSVFLFPLVFEEYKNVYDIKSCIDWGSLPKTVTDEKNKADYLASYVETYLKQELTEEGAIRKLEPFVRFLEICGIYNGQILNIENIARESFVSRSNVDNYFRILEDTLIGFRLEAFRPKWQSHELTHPKFYLFDSGVARACANQLFDDLDNSWRGFSFESIIVNEVKASNRYLKKNRNLYYYKVSGGDEIDLIIENKKKSISSTQVLTAIEIKLANRWDKRWNNALINFKQKSKGKVQHLYGVYCGKEVIQFPDLTVYPAESFLSKLAQGGFF